ncbi:hypothetical protein [Aquimarina sp. Aq78]|uniref:hypothetical protein n=1 Tax=Aquimarina sp. Aq78 TaxID=1191889 RepID=UPI000D10C67B|nr:hypothetical protein [Aquimarina sp. Aq78]
MIKIQIARLLIVFGFFLNLIDYGVELMHLYEGNKSKIVFNIEDTEENSDPLEKESSEIEDFKENDKISQYYMDEITSILHLDINYYPEFYIQNSSVFLEYTTPPPEIV